MPGKSGSDRNLLAGQGAEWSSALTLDALPIDVVELVKHCVLDVVGNVVAASRTPFGGAMRATAHALSGPGPARIIGFGDGTMPTVAALVNGAMATALDFDNTHTKTVLHFNSPTVTSAFALARGKSGKEVITAIACGAELMCRLGLSAPGEFHRRGFQATAVLSGPATAYTAAKMLRLPREATASAVAIAASMSAGLTETISEGKSGRFLYTGMASRLGVTAAILAQSGIEGAQAIFEGDKGLFAAHLGWDDTDRAASLFDGLGVDWEMMRSAFKPFPCGVVIFPLVQAALAVRAKNGFELSDIRGVECRVPPYAIAMVCEPAAVKKAPKSDTVARVSLPYTVAEALYRRTIDSRSYQPEFLFNKEILALAGKVSCTGAAEFDTREHFGGELIITLNSGKIVRHTEPFHWGSPQLPFGLEHLTRKFMDNMLPSFDEATAADIADRILRMETMTDVGAFIDKLAARRLS